MMKKITILSLFILSTVLVTAQKKSPKAQSSGVIDGGKVSVVYHSPSAGGRTIMGDLVPYGKVWRTGANNATTIEFEKDVKLEGKKLSAGKYSLYTIPGDEEWTIIINKSTNQWGTEYPEDSDALRVTVKPGKTKAFVESFKIEVGKSNVSISWENTVVSFAVK